jgi:hypothetical protein
MLALEASLPPFFDPERRTAHTQFRDRFIMSFHHETGTGRHADWRLRTIHRCPRRATARTASRRLSRGATLHGRESEIAMVNSV